MANWGDSNSVNLRKYCRPRWSRGWQ